MDMVTARDLGSIVLPASASAFVSATAAGTGDNTAVTGATIDRNSYGVALSALFLLAFTCSLTAAKTLTLKTVTVEDSADGSTWATYKTITDPGVVASATGTNNGVTSINVDLKSARRYVRLNWTPDLSASGTDTASIVAVAVMSGFDRLTPPTSAV